MMNKVRYWIFVGFATAGLVATVARGGTAGFGGGNYDGYDRRDAQRTLGFPVVNNAGGATNVLTTSAWLNGTLVDTGTTETAVSVYWGPTDGVTNKASWTNRNDFGVCSAGQSLTTNIAGLTQNAPYYYRFYATNTAGDEAWADAAASFFTLGPPSVSTSSGATGIGARTATLNGSLTAGGSATISVYWGQNSNNWSAVSNLGVCMQGVAFSNTVSGLHQGALYYYRCQATNAYGAAWSEVASFTTTLAPAGFGGGSYDGYDSVAAQTPMQTPKIGTSIVIF